MSNWNDYPMGPELRSFLDIADSEYTGDSCTELSPERQEEFEAYLKNLVAETPIKSSDVLAVIIPELVMRRHAGAAIAIAEQCNDSVDPTNFSLLLAIGSAYMIIADYPTSEKYFESAQALHPDELAPYSNMAQVLYLQQKDDELLKWIDAGLDVDANSRQIWEIYASYQTEIEPEKVAENLKAYATEKHSWAGKSLSFQVEAPEDAKYRAEQLEDIYKTGEMSEEFLIELTAALGVAEQYEKIPAIVWKADKLQGASQTLSWQLYAHAAQAQLGLNKEAEAKVLLKKSLADLQMNPEVRSEITALLHEIEEKLPEITPNSDNNAPLH